VAGGGGGGGGGSGSDGEVRRTIPGRWFALLLLVLGSRSPFFFSEAGLPIGLALDSRCASIWRRLLWWVLLCGPSEGGLT
jgi:hypothetical protein